MREYKFRALMRSSKNNASTWVYFGLKGKPKLQAYHEWVSPDLQFTGRADTNGDDIYEGHVLIAVFADRKKVIGEVYWSNELLTYVMLHDKTELPIKNIVWAEIHGEQYQ